MRIRVKVIPHAKHISVEKTQDMLSHDMIYKVRLTTPPVDGAANQQLIHVMAEYLHVPKRCIHIIQGHKDRRKILTIEQ